ncbi:hypothetical protein PLANPX_5540 [Lacipirellula parvula]|uniref:Uncharacterized protein n=1 Tax=Lacipirellula parvula TaxID=2650471 RepID=A0A5K7XHJ9_9BACT|nr:hypothetical protein PLANPX_5540 [Lacipirellula parvula]
MAGYAKGTGRGLPCDVANLSERLAGAPRTTPRDRFSPSSRSVRITAAASPKSFGGVARGVFSFHRSI